MTTYKGSCHCGRIAFEADGDLDRILVCNCSICTRKAYLHWIVPRAQFRLLTPPEHLATYQFNTKQAKHHFCPVCGCAPYYIARSDPNAIDVNVRCLEDVDLVTLPIETFDGQNWEAHYEIYRRDGS